MTRGGRFCPRLKPRSRRSVPDRSRRPNERVHLRDDSHVGAGAVSVATTVLPSTCGTSRSLTPPRAGPSRRLSPTAAREARPSGSWRRPRSTAASPRSPTTRSRPPQGRRLRQRGDSDGHRGQRQAHLHGRRTQLRQRLRRDDPEQGAGLDAGPTRYSGYGLQRGVRCDRAGAASWLRHRRTDW